MRLFDTIKKKEYWIHIAVIILAILLFENTVSQWILNYVQISELILSFVSKFIILVIVDLTLHKILEID